MSIDYGPLFHRFIEFAQQFLQFSTVLYLLILKFKLNSI